MKRVENSRGSKRTKLSSKEQATLENVVRAWLAICDEDAKNSST
jgi:hypothetical protein